MLPARGAGMLAVHLRRGPWGVIHADWPETAQAHIRLTSLGAITVALEGWR